MLHPSLAGRHPRLRTLRLSLTPLLYNEIVLKIHVTRVFAAVAFLCLAPAFAAPAIFPLKDVRAGQRGIGRTVFSGSRVEDFQVEILGVLENLGPRQSIILARLSGGPLENTGVMQGMSGSPVYIDGKLLGAIALSFPLSKAAIAGIRPIEDMLRVEPAPQASTGTAREIALQSPRGAADPRASFFTNSAKLEEIATPISFSGFTAATLENFAPQLRRLGFEPRQGLSGGGNPGDKLGDPKLLEPGSMISVQLISGDMSVGADGTVTAIDGDRIYAFGHRFLAEGPTELPFARAEVLALLPSLNSSFKISTAREWMGTITADRDTAISGFTGRLPSMIPVEIHVGPQVYRMRMIQDRIMTPLLTQMAIFSSIDSTQRSMGAQTYSVRGNLEFEGGRVRLNDVYSGDLGVAALAAGGVSSTIGFALQSGFDAMRLKTLNLEIAPVERRSHRPIVDLIAPRTARPGEQIEITTVFAGENGAETSARVLYRIPVGTPPGPLQFSASDATATNIIEYQSAVGMPPQSPEQVLDLLNGLRSNAKAYLRVWRSEPSFTVQGRDLPDPPPSLAMILNRQQAGTTNIPTPRGAKLAEIEVSPGPGFIVTGTKTVQVEVKE